MFGPAELVLLAPFVFVGFLVWLALNLRQGKQSKHAEVQKEILSKFSSGAEMREFLKSEEGRALFNNLTTEDGRPSRSLRERAISKLGIGIVLTVLGAGLMVLAHYSDQPQMLSADVQPPPGAGAATPPPASLLLEVPPGTGLPAAALFLTGVGLIVSSLLTLRLTSREQSHP